MAKLAPTQLVAAMAELVLAQLAAAGVELTGVPLAVAGDELSHRRCMILAPYNNNPCVSQLDPGLCRRGVQRLLSPLGSPGSMSCSPCLAR